MWMNRVSDTCPIITLDGPSGCGKSTVSRLLALKYNWALLDSGAIYRLLAWQASMQSELDLAKIADFFVHCQIAFRAKEDGSETQILLNDQIFDDDIIRSPDIGQAASKLAAKPEVRALLIDLQKGFSQNQKGLVAEGRDMGTVIFPDADLKIYMTASEEARNNRRLNQLQAMGQSVSISDLQASMGQRDARDQKRTNAPLVAAEDALVIDTSDMTIAQVVETIDQAYQNKPSSLR